MHGIICHAPVSVRCLFGCQYELLFMPNTSSTAVIAEGHVRDALEKWEPRVEVKTVSAAPDDTGSLRIEVVYQIVATGEVQSIDHVVSNTDRR